MAATNQQEGTEELKNMIMALPTSTPAQDDPRAIRMGGYRGQWVGTGGNAADVNERFNM